LVHGWESNASRWDLLPYLKKSGNHTLMVLHMDCLAEKNLAFQYAEFILLSKNSNLSILIGHSLGGKRVCITNRFIKVMP
jgi:hypothetical protein